MANNPTLEPSTFYRTLLLKYTKKLKGELQNEVIAAIEITKNKNEYRFDPVVHTETGSATRLQTDGRRTSDERSALQSAPDVSRRVALMSSQKAASGSVLPQVHTRRMTQR